ncbi:hypothetical protein [Saccharothrix violaceirubra]|uniref:Lipoprotein n=1 Tax=Saccharothrix violaceirubra TaxID=413306 RepID=A0A7W7T0H5_9PSEU|nr:hypothetical protein [Saccharothrix violaceirubra]MBB4964343.1 hypothetical protein [Saccharothrix violaceirubra]
MRSLLVLVALLAAGCAAPGGVVTGDRPPNVGRAELTVLDDAASISVRATDLDGRLFRTSGPVPHAVVEHGVVKVSCTGSGDIELDTGVVWSVRVAGGASAQTVDLRGARVGAVTFEAGASRIDLRLPSSTAVVPVRVVAGASEFVLHAPDGARITLGGGASQVVLDGVARDDVAAGTVLTTGDPVRYEVTVEAGVSRLIVARD